MTRSLHLSIATALMASVASFPAEPATNEPEPDPHVIASGKCHVSLCYEFDLGKSKFRIYTAIRASLYRYIPKGACTCSATKDDPGVFGLSASMTFQTKDGARIGNVAIGRAKDKSDVNLRTTYERFLSEQDMFEEVDHFQYRGFDFSDYRIYRERKARGDNQRYYFILKKPKYLVRGSRMEIAFNTPLGLSLNSPTAELSVASTLRLSDDSYFFQFFNSRNMPPAQWPATVEETVDLIESRLFPK